MRLETVAERVKRVIVKCACIDASLVGADVHLVRDLGLDSMDMLELALELREEFNTNLPDADVEIATVGDMVKYIEAVIRRNGKAVCGRECEN